MMDSLLDISSISDTQSISRISRSSSHRAIDRIDSLHSFFDHQSSLHHNATGSAVNVLSAANQFDKILTSFAICEDTTVERIKHKLILDSVIEASNNVNKSLTDEVAAKLRSILMIDDLKKYMHFSQTSVMPQEELTVLGIMDLPKHELSHAEKLNIKRNVEMILSDKMRKYIDGYENAGGCIDDVIKFSGGGVRKLFMSDDMQRLQHIEKLNWLCDKYETDILKCKALIAEWIKLKYKDMSAVNIAKAEYILLQAQVALVQARITKLSCIIRMFKELPVTVDAFQKLNTALDKKLQFTIQAIADKRNLKEQYDALHNTEFEEILQSYLDVCKSIKKKKQILRNL